MTLVKKSEITLEEYLQLELPTGCQEFRLVANRGPDNKIKFYIHPLNRDGVSRDFAVDGNQCDCVSMLAE